MKRIIVTYLILCLFIPISIEAKKKPLGNGLYWEIYDNGVLVISGNGDIPDFSLSSSGRGKWIKKAPWLSDLPQINKIIIEEGITSIGALSFYYESGRSKDFHLFCPVKEVFLPNSLIRIGYKSFCGCKQLNRINLNDGLKIIGDKAFSFCNLKEIIMPNTVETIGVRCFENNHSLQYVVLSNPITEIPKMAFMDCNQLSRVEFPIGLQTIGDYAFGFWDNTDHGELNSIILPAKMKSIGKMAFCGNRANLAYQRV